MTILGTTELQTVTLWGNARLVGAQMVASLDGVSSVTNTLEQANHTYPDFKYSVSFQAENAGDLLTLTLTPDDSEDNNRLEQLGISGVAVFRPVKGTVVAIQ